MGKVLIALVLVACASEDPHESSPKSEMLSGCLDTPGTLDYPPVGRLPCELIPPGVSLE